MPDWLKTVIDWVKSLTHWLKLHPELTVVLVAFSVLTFVGSIALVSVLIIRMPADYFRHERPPLDSFRGRHPAIRLTALVLKNFFGVVLVAVGIVLSFPGVPGQGILTILIGLELLNFPGKRRLELRIVRSRLVLRSINRIRAKYSRPPMLLPDRPGGDP